MNTLVEEVIKSEIQSIVSHYIFRYGIAVTAIIIILLLVIGYVLKNFIEKKISAQAEKEINKHKADIEISHAKKIGNYHHYISKKHEVYSKFNQLLLETEGLVSYQIMRSYPDFSKYTYQEIKAYMDRRNASENDISEVKNVWETNPKELQKKMQDFTDEYKLQKARRYWEKMNNFYWVNALYFSKHVSNKFKIIKGIMSELLITQENPSGEPVKFSREDMKILRDQTKKLLPEIDKIISRMKKELSGGFAK